MSSVYKPLPSTLCRSESLIVRALDGDKLAVGVDRLDEVLVGPDVVTSKRSTQGKCEIAFLLKNEK